MNSIRVHPAPAYRMTDEEIARELARRDLQLEYLHELLRSLGVAPDVAWTERVADLIDNATPAQRRAAALRVLARS